MNEGKQIPRSTLFNGFRKIGADTVNTVSEMAAAPDSLPIETSGGGLSRRVFNFRTTVAGIGAAILPHLRLPGGVQTATAEPTIQPVEAPAVQDQLMTPDTEPNISKSLFANVRSIIDKLDIINGTDSPESLEGSKAKLNTSQITMNTLTEAARWFNLQTPESTARGDLPKIIEVLRGFDSGVLPQDTRVTVMPKIGKIITLEAANYGKTYPFSGAGQVITAKDTNSTEPMQVAEIVEGFHIEDGHSGDEGALMSFLDGNANNADAVLNSQIAPVRIIKESPGGSVTTQEIDDSYAPDSLKGVFEYTYEANPLEQVELSTEKAALVAVQLENGHEYRILVFEEPDNIVDSTEGKRFKAHFLLPVPGGRIEEEVVEEPVDEIQPDEISQPEGNQDIVFEDQTDTNDNDDDDDDDDDRGRGGQHNEGDDRGRGGQHNEGD